MVAAIVGSSGGLLDDNSLRISRAAAYLGVHIVLSIVAGGKTPLAILEGPPSDIAGESLALMLPNGL